MDSAFINRGKRDINRGKRDTGGPPRVEVPEWVALANAAAVGEGSEVGLPQQHHGHTVLTGGAQRSSRMAHTAQLTR